MFLRSLRTYEGSCRRVDLRLGEGDEVDVFGASFDLEVTLARARKEADELRLWESAPPRGDGGVHFRWAGDDGETMWIETLPLEDHILDLLAKLT
jgi:hypothetical protein